MQPKSLYWSYAGSHFYWTGYGIFSWFFSCFIRKLEWYFRDVTSGVTSAILVATKLSDTLTLFQPGRGGGQILPHYCRGHVKNFSVVTSQYFYDFSCFIQDLDDVYQWFWWFFQDFSWNCKIFHYFHFFPIHFFSSFYHDLVMYFTILL